MTARLDAETARSLEAASLTRAINLIIGFIALVVAVSSAVLMVRTVSKQLGGEVFEAGNIPREISEGNLSVNISIRSGDSSSLLASLKSMCDRLRSMAGEMGKAGIQLVYPIVIVDIRGRYWIPAFAGITACEVLSIYSQPLSRERRAWLRAGCALISKQSQKNWQSGSIKFIPDDLLSTEKTDFFNQPLFSLINFSSLPLYFFARKCVE